MLTRLYANSVVCYSQDKKAIVFQNYFLNFFLHIPSILHAYRTTVTSPVSTLRSSAPVR
jgi:hypothetical protein